MPAEAEIARSSCPDLPILEIVGHIVQVTFRIRVVQVDGGGEESFPDRQNAGDGFDAAAACDAVAGHALCAGDFEFAGMIPKGVLDHFGFGHSVYLRGRTMSVLVLYFLWLQPCVFQCKADCPAAALA